MANWVIQIAICLWMVADFALDLAWYKGSMPYAEIYALTSTIVLMLLFIAQAIVIIIITNKVY